ncbi:MAG: hypothetical protein NZM04_02185 [Methylacidiphilales bacterium]|nr:hypothetical protein [Candidatus Methylacidiphilales bacterium]MDW8350007.1 hypothetical protein [Verrucomicrobiae bacterium]
MTRSLGQTSAWAILSGMKSLVANLTWLEVTSAWEKRDWFLLKQKVSLATLLDPQFEMFWEMGAWHLAWNAAYDAERRAKEQASPRAESLARHWIREGEALLRQGIAVLPQSYRLHYALASLLHHRLEDYAGAAEAYLAASQQPGALPFLERFAGYMMEKSGQLTRAYEHYCAIRQKAFLKNEPQSHWEKIDQRIAALEAQLNIPTAARCSQRFQPQVSIPSPHGQNTRH